MRFFPLAFIMFFFSSVAFSSFSLKINSGVMQSSSSVEDKKYAELELGYTYTVSEALGVRGAVFGRSADEETFLGAELSIPVSLVVPGGLLGSYLAPGYRYMSDSFSAPLIEGGLNLYFLGSFGLGYRVIFNEWVKNGLKNESQFFGAYYF